MAMRIAVMALRKAAEARMNTRKPMRPSHSTRSRKFICRSFGRYPTAVNSFLAGKCAVDSGASYRKCIATPGDIVIPAGGLPALQTHTVCHPDRRPALLCGPEWRDRGNILIFSLLATESLQLISPH